MLFGSDESVRSTDATWTVLSSGSMISCNGASILALGWYVWVAESGFVVWRVSWRC